MASSSYWTEGVEGVSNLRGMILKRHGELALVARGAAYLMSSVSYKQGLMSSNTASFGETDDVDELILDELRRSIPRLSVKSFRHECYRICILARIEGMTGIVDDLKWSQIEELLNEAEAVLKRQGEPADIQALAITRLIHAELSMRRAEMLLSICMESTDPDPTITVVERLAEVLKDGSEVGAKARCLLSHERATQLLESIEHLLSEGRGENRWRWFLAVTRGRVHILYALRQATFAPVKAMEHLSWAGRFLHDARINCGDRTDRWGVLESWWSLLREIVTSKLFSSSGLAQWHLLTSRVGEDWNLNWEQM